MCGIVGFSGSKPVVDILVEGLKKLEYRGYDSAGVAMQQDGDLVIIRSPGKIVNLESKLNQHVWTSVCGIAHTRWATHGAPNEANAHPHASGNGRIAVVHNGIIENYGAIKARLQQDGVEFRSETDTEVIAHLVERLYEGDLEKAVIKTLGMLEGAFGLVVIHADEPGTLVGARRGSPLLLGIGEDGLYFASDVSAILHHTKTVVYLDDDDVALIQDGKYRVSNLRSAEVQRQVQSVDFDIEHITKSGFAHFMLKEIFEQPDTVRNATRGRILTGEGTAKLSGLENNLKELRSIDRIILLACGTSYYAGMVGEYMIEELSGIPVEVEYASEFRYRNPIIGPHTVVFAISQSGETADTLAAMREAQRKGATVLGICNAVGSTIARQSNGGVYLHAGPEIGVASTKAFTAQVSVLALVALVLGRMRRVSHEQGATICAALQTLPAQIQEILELNGRIATIAKEFYKSSNFLYLGRHYNYPVAMEGALKLKEISYIHAEGYPAAEMKHGPIALIDENMPVVVVAPHDGMFDKVCSNMQEIRARRGRIICVTDDAAALPEGLAEHVIEVPKTIGMLMPILTCVPLQLLAYHIAVLRGNDVDQPRNLAKSVTVE